MGITPSYGVRPFVLRHSGATIALALVCVLAVAVGSVRLSFDPRYSTFFAADDPQLVAFEHLREVFGPSDAVSFVVEAPQGDVFSATSLELLEVLTARAWHLPFAQRVESLTNYSHSSVDCAPDDPETCDLVTIAPLVDAADALDAADRASVRAIALAAPELAGRLVDAVGERAAVVVTVRPHGDPMATNQAIVEAARALAAELERAHPGARGHVGGIVAMNHAFGESSLADSMVLLPIMFGLMVVGLAWLLGAAHRALALSTIVLCSLMAALGAAGWLGMGLTTPAAIAPIVIATIAVAQGVHVVFGAYGAEDAADHAGRLARSLEENTMPVALTTLTTVLGFLSLNFSAVPPFRDLGNLVALGVLAAGALTLTLLPALLLRLPNRGRPPRVPRAALAAFADFALAHRARLRIGAVIVLLVALPGLGRLQVNDDFVAYFDEALPFRTAAELTDRHLGGMYELEQQLIATGGSIHEPAFLASLDAYTAWLRAQPETGHVLAWTDTLRRIDGAVQGGGGLGELPASADLAAQYTLLFELSLPLGLDLTNVLAPDYGSLRQVVMLRDVDSRAVLDFERRAMAWLEANAPHIAERHGGINLMFAHISERNVEAMFEGNLLAVLLIAGVLAIALRSLLLAGASLVTNLVPVAAAFALWGWLVGDLGLALSTTFGMTLGIVVDDTVHLLARYRRRRSDGANAQQAMHDAMTEVGPALVVTTIVLSVGFAVLATSTFAINGLLAQVTLLTVVLALAFDLLALPALLVWRGSPPVSQEEPRRARDDRLAGAG